MVALTGAPQWQRGSDDGRRRSRRGYAQRKRLAGGLGRDAIAQLIKNLVVLDLGRNPIWEPR